MGAWVERNAGWLIALVVLALLGAVAWTIIFSWQRSTTVRLGDAVVSAEIASTKETRDKGLSQRTKLAENNGLLLVYDREGSWGVWMKEMKIPIDIVWLNEKKQVVHITKNVYPSTYPDVFKPSKPAKYILELAAGVVKDTHIRINQTAHFDLPR